MFRPKLDHKFFTSDTYWTKWNYLSKWDSSTMNNKDIVVNGVLKNPSITTSYEKGQWASFDGTELTIIIDYNKTPINKYLGFNDNQKIKILNVFCINYDTSQEISDFGYMFGSVNTINLTVLDKNGKAPEYVKIKGFFLTEASNLVNFNCNTNLAIMTESAATLYSASNVHFNCKIIVNARIERVVNIMNYEGATIPFTKVNAPIRLDNYPYGAASKSLSFLKANREEWVRWFTEDLETVQNSYLVLGSDNLAKLTDEDKKIATDKGWTLA